MTKDLLPKMEKYCAFQERCESEVIHKLTSLQASPQEIDSIIISLKQNDFLNESRFVDAFIRGKLNHCHWGTIKIVHHLEMKGINSSIIRQYISEIEDNKYKEVLQIVIDKWLKMNEISNQSLPKLYRHLLSKGFENQIISSFIKENYPSFYKH